MTQTHNRDHNAVECEAIESRERAESGGVSWPAETPRGTHRLCADSMLLLGRVVWGGLGEETVGAIVSILTSRLAGEDMAGLRR